MIELFNDFKRINLNDEDEKQNDKELKLFLRNPETFKRDGSKEPSQVSETMPASLYIGDLDVKVTEEALLEFFKDYTSLSSVKICYKPHSSDPLGYGYVNFKDEKDAARAMEELNYVELLDREVRIMPIMKIKTDQKKKGSNVFLSNLNTEGLTLRLFYDKFKTFGEILSCKLIKDKNQAFILFKDETVAQRFVLEYNNKIVDGSQIFVSMHIPKHLRVNSKLVSKNNVDFRLKVNEVDTASSVDTQFSDKLTAVTTAVTTATKSDQEDKFLQIFAKGLPLNVTESQILNLFSSYGKVDSVFKQAVKEFNSSWAIVTFAEHPGALSSMKALNKTIFNGRKLTVTKFIKKKAENGDELPVAIKDKPVGKSTKLYLYNLPPGCNKDFFTNFIKYYKLKGELLAFSINKNKSNNYIEFSESEDAVIISRKLDGVNICGFILQTSLLRLDGFKDEDEPPSRAASVVYSPYFHPQMPPFPHPFPHMQHLTGNRLAYPAVNPTNLTMFNPVFAACMNRPESESRQQLSSSSKFSIEAGEEVVDKLEKISLRCIDFLKYPSSTRKKNLRRIIQFLIDTFWGNDLSEIELFIARFEHSSLGEQELGEFKTRLVDTIEMFGYGR